MVLDFIPSMYYVVHIMIDQSLVEEKPEKSGALSENDRSVRFSSGNGTYFSD